MSMVEWPMRRLGIYYVYGRDYRWGGESHDDVYDTGVASDVTCGCGRGWMSTAGCSEPYLEVYILNFNFSCHV